MKSENQSIWSRGAPDAIKRKREDAENSPQAPLHAALDPTAPRGTDVIILHPGSRWIRVGRATDPFPVSVPHVIARKVASNYPRPTPRQRIPRLGKGIPFPGGDKRRMSGASGNASSGVADSEPVHNFTDDLVCWSFYLHISILINHRQILEAVQSIRIALISRMEFYKLKHDPAESIDAARFNQAVAPEVIEEEEDPYRVEWVNGKRDDNIFFGHKV